MAIVDTRTLQQRQVAVWLMAQVRQRPVPWATIVKVLLPQERAPEAKPRYQ